jgi:hypothetical protein
MIAFAYGLFVVDRPPQACENLIWLVNIKTPFLDEFRVQHIRFFVPKDEVSLKRDQIFGFYLL